MNTTHTAPLLTALAQVGPHDHLCSIYESPEEYFAVAVPFIRIGLDRGEKCLYIADDGAEGIVRDAMRAGGIDVERAIATNSLSVEGKSAAYMKRGSFDPQWMFTFWEAAAANARERGFKGVRVTGETEWVVRGAPGLERWVEYESRLTRTLADHHCLALCQYNRRLFTPELLLDVIRTHPTVIYRGEVCRNMYYVPPEELLGTDQAPREVERLLSNIREREEVEYTLRQSERLLRLVLDALPVAVSVVDLAGDIGLTNSAARRLWGGSIRSGRDRYAESKGWWHVTGERVAPEEWPSVRAFSRGETSVNNVIEIEAFDGVRRIMQTSAVPIRDANDRITGAVIVNEDVSDRKTAERELKESYDRMRSLTGRLMRAQDDERRRIAQLLHDTTAQDLAGLRMLLSRVNRTAQGLSEGELNALTESRALAEQSMNQIRTLSYLMHPPFLDERGLVAALRWYATGFSERSGVEVDLDLPDALERLPLDTETALFRIVQESLINIHRHAESATARIELRREPETLLLEIADRGHGMPQTALKDVTSRGAAGVGIAGIRERVEQLGGRLEITSSDHGTTVRVLLPLPKDAG